MSIESPGDEVPTGSQHPAEKPIEPEHPMLLEGGMAPGDVALMTRCLLEELLMLGESADRVRAMTSDPNYQALFAARCALGDEQMEALFEEVVGRIGQHHHRTVERQGDVQAVTLTVKQTS